MVNTHPRRTVSSFGANASPSAGFLGGFSVVLFLPLLLLLGPIFSTTEAFVLPSCSTKFIKTTRANTNEICNNINNICHPATDATLTTTFVTLSVTGSDDGSSSSSPALETTTATTTTSSKKSKQVKKGKKTWKELRQEGGLFTFNTPIGALNPFAIYYGCISLFLGIPWLISLKTCQILYFITRGRFDPKRRLPVFFSHVWGTAVLRLSRSYPEIEGLDVLQKFYKESNATSTTTSKPAMFVANHCSWMDIPFLGATVGWRNYKIVSKKELGMVPILGSAIKAGGNIMVDRTDRRSQIKTLKQGINYLKKDGIHLCTFPEGTRSRTGRLMAFKNGAFKMAHKAGAPVVPISIINSHKVMPTGWMFSMKPSYKTAKIIVHPPIESEGKTEAELAEAVRQSMISGLPDYQKPRMN